VPRHWFNGQKAVVDDVTSSLAAKENLTAEDVTRAANLGDATAVRVIEQLARKIALGMGPTILTLNPEALVIGGGIQLTEAPLSALDQAGRRGGRWFVLCW
jgi:predicted NBD/HSP70 family sugar kinase